MGRLSRWSACLLFPLFRLEYPVAGSRMVNKKKTFLLLITAILLLVGVDVFTGRIMSWQGIPAGEEYLNTYELITLRHEVSRGDAQAAKKLMWFYDGFKNDRKKYYEWEKKAAELGDTDSQYTYGSRLFVQGNKKEGIVWLKKAASKGSDKAKVFLNDRTVE